MLGLRSWGCSVPMVGLQGCQGVGSLRCRAGDFYCVSMSGFRVSRVQILSFSDVIGLGPKP